jgi:HPr kinase/phosphorylase
VSLHGTLVDVGGTGVILLGPSGIGKSECALELVRRGYRLVADDVVVVAPNANGEPIGRAPEHMGHHMEIRGLGILSIPDLFGEEAVQAEARIDLACRFERDLSNYDRVGLSRPTLAVGGAEVPCLTLPGHAGGILATLVEVAARDLVLRRRGVNAAERFDAQLRHKMTGG